MVRVVEGITLSQRLSVTAVGRARPERQQARHGIKAVDRFLSKPKLQRGALALVKAERGKSGIRSSCGNCARSCRSSASR